MVKFSKVFLVLFLVFSMGLTPGLIQAAFAADAPTADQASGDEVQAVQQLAKNGYLGDKKDFVLSAKALTEDDITDAVIQAGDSLASVEVKDLKPGSYRLEDLQALLGLVKDKGDDIRARKVSAWKYENKLKKMIAALSPDSAAATPAPGAVKTPQAEAPKPTPTAAVIPGPSREEFSGMKADVKDLTKSVGDLQATFDKKFDSFQKTDDEVKASNAEVKAGQADIQDQLALVKRLLDRMQDDLKKTDDRLDEVSKKADEKSISDEELQQELNVMHKDLRDNTQDVSILKQEIAKLDKASDQAGESPLDSVLSSKWLGGGALLVGIAALVVALTKK